MTTTTRLLLLGAILLAAPLNQATAAPTPTVSASVSGYTAIGSGAIPESQWVPLAVTRNDRPGHAEASGSGGSFISTPIGPGLKSFFFTSASATGFASADSGVLRIYGADLAIAQPAIIGPNLPPALNTSTVYTNIQVSASFTDYLTVNAPGLAVGTPVQVPFNLLAEAVSNYPLGHPQFSAHPIGVSVSFKITGIGDQNISSESGLGSFGTRTDLMNGTSLYTVSSRGPFNVAAQVGDVLTISTSFSIFGQANLTDSFRPSEWGGFVDGRNTAAIWLGDLPNGLVVTSASGHDYRLDPTLAQVPLPVTVWLLGSAIGGLGFVRRRIV